MFKNKIKAWNLRKYLKEDEAKLIIEAESTNRTVPAGGDGDDIKERAERSLKRKRARQRANTVASPILSTSSPIQLPVSPVSQAVVPFTPPPSTFAVPPPEPVRLTGVAEKFLYNLRSWTHEAFLKGHWEQQSSAQLKLRRGRQASRVLSSSLNSGISLFQNGKQQLAWKEWNRAIASFKNPELFKSWYYEIPLSLLFEVSRVAQSGHAPLGSMLLKNVNTWAHTFLEPEDTRHGLFSLFGELEVDQIRDLYGRAARSMMDGLESRIEKGNRLLYEVRLNRALDLLWYDENADLSDIIPPVSEVDTAMDSPNNALSVYFLLLEAYRSEAQGKIDEAEDLCAQVQSRLNVMVDIPDSIDWWRVGLVSISKFDVDDLLMLTIMQAYRRLGRMQHSKGRYPEARRSFNIALKHVKSDSSLSRSVLIEICQRQQTMARAIGDQTDEYLWTHMLEQLEQKAQVEEIDDEEEVDPINKKLRLQQPNRTSSPGPQRRQTWA